MLDAVGESIARISRVRQYLRIKRMQDQITLMLKPDDVALLHQLDIHAFKELPFLAVGDNVKDGSKKGIVTSITIWPGELSAENHGIIEVLFNDGSEEHYSYFGWYKSLIKVK